MKKDITKMLKCRAIFLQSLATLNNGIIRFDETLDSLLDGFFDSYIRGNFDKFSLIYYFQHEKGKLVIHEEDEWELELFKYLNYFLYQDDKNILKLYNDVGMEAVNKSMYRKFSARGREMFRYRLFKSLFIPEVLLVST